MEVDDEQEFWDHGAAGTLLILGWVGVVVGVPAEKYPTDLPNAHAVQVIGDTLFWIQQNLITMARLCPFRCGPRDDFQPG